MEKLKKIKNMSTQTTPHEKWEALKIAVIINSQNYCTERALNRNTILQQLEKYVEKMENVQINDRSETDIKILEKTKTDIIQMREEKIQGVIFRTKATWYNESEASTKYFYNLEKSKSGAKNMNSILLDNGMEIFETKEILNQQYKFYKKLYTAKDIENFSFENETNLRVPKEFNDIMKEDINIQELRNAVKNMSKNKSPGIDGLTTEFYQVFF